MQYPNSHSFRTIFVVPVVTALYLIVNWQACAEPVAGDLDGSGAVNAVDVQMTVNSALGLSTGYSGDIDWNGITDAVDIQLSINAALGIVIDTDGDGLCDAAEANLGTRPDVVDTDNDGVGDGQEILDGTNPLSADAALVPGVVGMTQADAESAIVAAGLTVGAMAEEYNESAPAGEVTGQNPTAGTAVSSGTTVALTVSKGPDPGPNGEGGTWTRTFGGTGQDQALSIKTTPGGGYMVAGSFEPPYPSTSSSAVYALQLDSNGQKVWSSSEYGGATGGTRFITGDWANDVAVLSDGSSVFVGARLLKFSSSGEAVWERYLGEEVQWSVAETPMGMSVAAIPAGGFMVAGLGYAPTTTKQTDFITRIYVLRTDENGHEIWSKLIGTDFVSVAYTIVRASDGSYVVGGLSMPSFSSADLVLIDIDTDGNILWQRSLKGEGGALNLKQTLDGGFIIAGGDLTRTDAQGQKLWARSYNDEIGGRVTITSVAVKGAERFAFAGYVAWPDGGTKDMILGLTNGQGDLQWWKHYGGDNIDVAKSLALAPDGGYVLAGNTSSYGNGGSDVYIVKTDANGNASSMPTTTAK